MSKQRFAMQIAYDGSAFLGWQIQVLQPTVQQTLEHAFSLVAKKDITIVGSGRTDTGVHATCQVAHFDWDMNMTPEQIRLAVHSKIPKSIEIVQIWPVVDSFHSRYSAYQRTYHYYITKQRHPFNQLYQSYIPKCNFKLPIIQECIQFLIGKHDFSSLSKPNPQVTNHICDIQLLEFKEYKTGYCMTIQADRFLHNMVRRIVGLLATISQKQLPAATVRMVLGQKRADQKLVFTAPAEGLYLTKIAYPIDLFPFEFIPLPINNQYT